MGAQWLNGYCALNFFGQEEAAICGENKGADGARRFYVAHADASSKLTAGEKKPRVAPFLSEVLVRVMGRSRSALIFLLIACLAELPAEAAESRALGFVQNAQSSFVNNIPAANGTNLAAGDVFSTESDGSALLRLGANRIFMQGKSGVALTAGNQSIVATVTHGSVEFSSPEGSGIALRADDVVVRPKTPEMTRAQVTLLSSSELRITSVAGALDLELDGKSYTLDPGRTYGVRIVEEHESGAFQSPRTSKGLIILVLTATATVAGIIFLVKELHESPEVP